MYGDKVVVQGYIMWVSVKYFIKCKIGWKKRRYLALKRNIINHLGTL